MIWIDVLTYDSNAVLAYLSVFKHQGKAGIWGRENDKKLVCMSMKRIPIARILEHTSIVERHFARNNYYGLRYSW